MKTKVDINSIMNVIQNTKSLNNKQIISYRHT